MAVDANKVFQLARSVKGYGLRGRIGTLGVQAIHPDRRELAKILENEGFSLLDNGDLYESLGFDCAESLDISDYEGCSHIVDLNAESLPDRLSERFDVIYNGGTLEHVFDLRAALRNIFRMLKPSGVVIHAGPTNGWIDHGFYQFSPTFFTDYYLANHFEILEFQLMQDRSDGDGVIVHAYNPGYLDALSSDFFHGRWGFYSSFRKNLQSSSELVPQQGYYNRLYGESPAVSSVAAFQYAPPFTLRDGCVVEEDVVRITLDKPQRGDGYEWIVKLPGLSDIADNQSSSFSSVQLWEGDKALGPPHSLHKDIRELGEGRFSHWGEWLHFSTSDNRDPGKRVYSITIPAT